MGFLDRIKASYSKLETEQPPAPAKRARPVRLCDHCTEPAFTGGLCAQHALSEARAVTRKRKREEHAVRRGLFFRAKRAARKAGDWALWNELTARSLAGHPFPADLSQTAGWRKKWSNISGPVKS